MTLAACGSASADRAAAELGAPVQSARDLLAGELDPQHVGRRLGNIGQRLRGLLGEPQRTAVALRNAASALPDEALRATHARDLALGWLGDTVTHLPRGVPEWLADEVSPASFGTAARSAVDRAAALLVPGHRPLGEHDDLQHRTDPGDDRPEAPWLDRILRRILP